MKTKQKQSITTQRPLPTDQQAILERCFHPTGQWEEFPESALNGSLVDRFEAIAARYPNRVAAKQGDDVLTYAELNRAANRVARGLIERRGTEAEPVPLIFAHETDYLVAIWGVLKAGKFYVPLDASYPVEHNQQILGELDAALLVTNQQNLATARQVGTDTIALLTLESVSDEDDSNLSLTILPEAFAYVIFTSGSTGRPKGVIEDHRDVIHFSRGIVNFIHICPDDRLELMRSISFNGSAGSIYPALLTGASLWLFDLRTEGMAALAPQLTEEGVTIAVFLPSFFRQWAPTLPKGQNFPQLRYLRLGAEKMYPSDWALYRDHFADSCILRHGLGTSETKFGTHYYMDKETTFVNNHVPIGYAVEDVEVQILGKERRPLPQGEVGEIVFRSPSMARGYWKNPELTAAKFLTDPHVPELRLYLTGDLGRLDENGYLYHLGREDFQVKIRGQRVELNEIEAALLAMESIQDAVVDARPNHMGDMTLVAWLVVNQPSPPLEMVRGRLAQRLPAYKIPAHFVLLDQLPLTSARKVDRKALPDPSFDRPLADSAWRAPSTPLEEWLVGVWEEVLGIQGISVDDDFLELGGDSLKAMRIVSQLHDELDEHLYVITLFDAPTIADYAAQTATNYRESAQQRFGLASVPDQNGQTQGPAKEPTASQDVGSEQDSHPDHTPLLNKVQPQNKSSSAEKSLTERQREALATINHQLANPTEPQTWREVTREHHWHRRRKAIRAGLTALPSPLADNPMATLCRSEWWTNRFYAKQIALTKSFLALIAQAGERSSPADALSPMDEKDFIRKSLYYNCVHHYNLASRPVSQQLQNMIDLERFKEAHAKGKGVVIVTGHQVIRVAPDLAKWGPLMRIGSIHHYASHFGIDDESIVGSLFANQLNAARQVLHSGGVVRIAADGHQGIHSGNTINFLGRHRPFHSSFAELALLTDSPIICMRPQINAEGNLCIRFAGPLDAGNDKNSHGKRVEGLVLQYVELLRQMWIESPWLVPWYQMERHLGYPPAQETQ